METLLKPQRDLRDQLLDDLGGAEGPRRMSTRGRCDGYEGSGQHRILAPEPSGFTWADTSSGHTVKCDCRQKVAQCTSSATITMVTARLLTRDDDCNFVLKITHAGGKQVPIIFGIVDGSVDSVRTLKIGDPELPSSFGAACIRKSGKLVQNGNALGPAPGICDGDVVRLRIQSGGKVSLFKGNTQIGNCTVGGKGEFRVAVTFQEEGQQAVIVEDAHQAWDGSASNNLKLSDMSQDRPWMNNLSKRRSFSI